jgi:3-methylcrotonyl-CoA carboxylase alpha subunit
LVEVGSHVETGQTLVIMEAMKMEHTIRAPASGIIKSLNCREGVMVEAGTVLVEFEAGGG